MTTALAFGAGLVIGAEPWRELVALRRRILHQHNEPIDQRGRTYE